MAKSMPVVSNWILGSVIGITVVSLVVMGAANMLIPALCVIIAALLALRVKLDRDPSVEKEAV